SRLRHVGPVGAMLSGGLDSSTIVSLISHRHRSELQEPLRTFSLTLEDKAACGDWQAVAEILRHDPWLRATAVASGQGEAFAHVLDQSLVDADEPFGVLSAMPYQLLFEAVAASGCKLVFDGMAGDLLFYSPEKTLAMAMRETRLDLAPALLRASGRHQMLAYGGRQAARSVAARLTPAPLRAAWRSHERDRRLRTDVLGLLRPGVARRLVEARESARPQQGTSDLERHAALFTSGLLSFAHERNGSIAGQYGIETLSPFADRRMIEFAIRMPLAAKLALPWYKHLLRNGTDKLLPDSVRWRRSLEGHPGWQFYERLWHGICGKWPRNTLPAELSALEPWIDAGAVAQMWSRTTTNELIHGSNALLPLAIAAKWLRLNRIS
ncbi:MAG: asparagine synthase, partial [Ramlibacter sp.]|nr:asparagine synthase [Ramlibacter sp.]